MKGHAKITPTFNKLLRKDIHFLRTNDCDLAFNLLKQKLASAPVLAFANNNKPKAM